MALFTLLVCSSGIRWSIRTFHLREGLPHLSIGVGIHRGLGLAGLVGSRERKEFSFLGSPVNLAARVQALTRLHRVDILVTEELRTELDKGILLTPMPAEHVKGFADPVVTYAVKGTIEPRSDEV